MQDRMAQNTTGGGMSDKQISDSELTRVARMLCGFEVSENVEVDTKMIQEIFKRPKQIKQLMQILVKQKK